MGAYVYGLINTTLFVLLGKLFIETFFDTYRFESRGIRCGILAGMTIGTYVVSVLCNGNWILKEVMVLIVCTLFMWGYFKQSILRTGAFILLY